MTPKRPPATSNDYRGPTPPDPLDVPSISTRYDPARTRPLRSVSIIYGAGRRCLALRTKRAPRTRLRDRHGDLASAFRKAVGPFGSVVAPTSSGDARVARTKAPGIQVEVADVTRSPTTTPRSTSPALLRHSAPERPAQGIAEMARTLRSGGRLIVLEFGQPRSRIFGAAYNFYRTRVMRSSAARTGEQDAYEYLEGSAGRSPAAKTRRHDARAADFSSVEYRTISSLA